VKGSLAGRGYRLPAKHVIHTVGPVFTSHTPEEADRLLSSAYRQAAGRHLRAFPTLECSLL
jgi:O-acetyl-ADP-ribose deacetylase (regulator of RNase III)